MRTADRLRSSRVYRDSRKAFDVVRSSAVFRRHGIRSDGPPSFRGASPVVANAGRIVTGRRLRIIGVPSRALIGTGADGVLEIGDDVYINSGASVFAEQRVTIGDNTMIADFASVRDSDFHRVDMDVPVRVAPIVIGRNVWIGRNAVVLPGVTVGNHSVVAAGAIVSRDVPPRTVVAGVPARVMRELRADDHWARS